MSRRKVVTFRMDSEGDSLKWHSQVKGRRMWYVKWWLEAYGDRVEGELVTKSKCVMKDLIPLVLQEVNEAALKDIPRVESFGFEVRG